MRWTMILTAMVVSTTASAAGKEVGLFSMADYPPEALARNEEGTVKFRLQISTEGRAIGCEILQSATQALDAATCYVLMRRARFTPGKDEAGAPAKDTYDGAITWKISDEMKENRHNNSTRMQN